MKRIAVKLISLRLRKNLVTKELRKLASKVSFKVREIFGRNCIE